MKVAQKVRLLTKDKDGRFIKNDTFAVLRNRAVIQPEVVKETEENYKDTGVLWIVDVKETKAWADSKKPKTETKVEPKAEKK